MKLKLAFLLSLLLVWVFWPGSGRQWVEINVRDGQNAHAVADQLIATGLIRIRHPFIMWVKVRRAEKLIKVGRYRISRGRSGFWIVDDLVQGRVEKVRFVIPEGFASWQIAERLGEMGICDGEAFKEVVRKENLEGFLFPATYELPHGLSPANVARKFTAQFHQRWTAEVAARAQERGVTQLQVVTLASIIEREVMRRDELPMVAAVYHNRLKKNMKLDADPTVQFALGYWKTRLTYDDYRKTQSPYNTYIRNGLPPGPICSPGWDAIEAALQPAASNALYLLGREDGYHTFSETLREHTNKVNKRNRSRR